MTTAATAQGTSDIAAKPVRLSGRRAMVNTLAIAAGSNFAALGRLVVLALIARQSGELAFAKYAVLIEVFKLAEGLLDFGTSEVFVREVNQRPRERTHLLRTLLAAKLLQLPIAMAVLAVALLGFISDPEFVKPGMAGALSLVAYAVVLVYRVPFRAELSMAREVIAELCSVATMIVLMLTIGKDAGITTLIWAYVASRMVFGGLTLVLGARRFVPSLAGVTKADIAWTARATAVIGVAGFIVVAYQTMDMLLLESLTGRTAGSLETAYFAAGQKLAWPVLMALAAVGGTLYSMIAAAWPDDKPRFERACQLGLDAVFLLAGVPVCLLFAGSTFLVGLLDKDLATGGAPVARLTGLLCLVKAVSMTIGPALFVVHKQKWVLVMLVIALGAKAGAIAFVAPRDGLFGGATGVAWASLVIETLLVAVPSILLVQRFTGFRPRWWVALRAAACGVAALLATSWIWPDGGPWAAMSAPGFYGVLLVGSGTAKPMELLRTLRGSKKPAERVPGASEGEGE